MILQEFQCTLCRRRIKIVDQFDMPVYDPNTGFAICKKCIRDINHYLDEHDPHAHDEEQNLKEIFAGELGGLLKKISLT